MPARKTDLSDDERAKRIRQAATKIGASDDPKVLERRSRRLSPFQNASLVPNERFTCFGDSFKYFWVYVGIGATARAIGKLRAGETGRRASAIRRVQRRQRFFRLWPCYNLNLARFLKIPLSHANTTIKMPPAITMGARYQAPNAITMSPARRTASML
jgi:hypothetical protein